MSDDFSSRSTPMDGPAPNREVVTPSDTVNLAKPTRGVYVGVTGDVSVEMLGGGTGIFKNAPQGQVLPIRVTRVNATGTTATDMLGLS